MKRQFVGVTLIAMALMASAASAQAPRGMVSQTSVGGFYLWADGSYQSINLPSVGNFGYRAQVFPSTNIVANEKHDPRADGSGVKGAIGYRFRDGAFPISFGSNQRIELGGSYVKATGTSSASNSNSDVNIQVFNLQGVNPIGTAGCGGSTCSTPSTLSSDYQAWNIFLTGKSDFKSGALTLTPSLTFFAGKGRTQQGLAQQLLADGAPYPPGAGGNTYNMDAALDWNDWGAMIGLDARYDVNAWLSFGLGGTAGWARRSASLSASDSLRFPSDPRTFTSSVEETAAATPFVSNAEANVVLRPGRNMSIKGFVGLNYDSRVPGIAGVEIPPGAASGTQAQIKFESQTSYYAGGGVTVIFTP